MSIQKFLNIKAKTKKEIKEKRELERLKRLKPIPEAVKNDIKLKKAVEKKKEERELKKAKKLTDEEKKQLIMEEMKKGIKMVIAEEFDDIDNDDEKVEKVLGELGDQQLDEIKLQDAIEEEILRKQYEIETGKDALILNGEIRKDYSKWKNEQLKEVKKENE